MKKSPTPLRLALLASLIAASASGCSDEPDTASAVPAAAGPSQAAGSGQPTLPGTLRTPTAPPRTPTEVRPVNWVVGRVTKGGSGPCYGLVTDDERQFALYGTTGITLKQGTYVRVQFAIITPKVDCGPGQEVGLVKATPVK